MSDLRWRNGETSPNDEPGHLTDVSNLPWYILRANTRYGPYSYEALQKSVAARVLGKTDFVWCPGLSEWKSVQEIEGFIFSRRPSEC
jgi:hypothetical protein